jgi:hypothetical protein
MNVVLCNWQLWVVRQKALGLTFQSAIYDASAHFFCLLQWWWYCYPNPQRTPLMFQFSSSTGEEKGSFLPSSFPYPFLPSSSWFFLLILFSNLTYACGTETWIKIVREKFTYFHYLYPVKLWVSLHFQKWKSKHSLHALISPLGSRTLLKKYCKYAWLLWGLEEGL